MLKKLARRYPQYAKRSIYHHAGKPVVVNGPKTNMQTKRGRPKKLTERDELHIINTMLKVRRERASFTCVRVREESDIYDTCVNKDCTTCTSHEWIPLFAIPKERSGD